MTADPNPNDLPARARAVAAGRARPAAVDADHVRAGVDVRRRRRRVRRRVRHPQPGPDQPPQRLPSPRLGHPGRHDRAGDPEAAGGLLLPRLAARAPQTGRTGADLGRRHLLPARRLDPADGEAGRAARDHPAVEVPGLDHGQRPRRPGRGVPDPAVGRRPLHVRRRRRVDDEGPRGRPGRQRRLPRRERGQCRRAPRDPRPGRLLEGVPGRLADVLPRPDRPRPVRGQPGDLRRPPRSGRRDRRDPARRRPGSVAAPTTRRT